MTENLTESESITLLEPINDSLNDPNDSINEPPNDSQQIYDSLIEQSIRECGRPGKWLMKVLNTLRISTIESINDSVIADVFTYLFWQDVRYIYGVSGGGSGGNGSFLWWQDGKWHIGQQGVYNRCRALEMLFREVLRKGCGQGEDGDGDFNKETNEGQWKWLMKAAHRVGSIKHIRDMMFFLTFRQEIQGEEKSVGEGEIIVQLETGGYGVLDMYKGEVREVSKRDIVIKSTKFTLPLGRVGEWVSREEVERSKYWESLEYLMRENEADVSEDDGGSPINDIEFMLRVLGYVCSGHTEGQYFFWIEGESRNGKSVVTDPFLELLGLGSGGLSISLSSDTFTIRASSASSFALAGVEGKRFIKVSEPPGREGAGFALDEELIKKITGDSAMMVKGFYKEPKVIDITGKVVFVCNHAPRISDNSGAVNLRLIRVKTPGKTIPEAKREQGRTDHIIRYEQKVLAWLLCKGYKDYMLRGLLVPDKFKGWNKENKRSTMCSNDTREFVEDCLGVVDGLEREWESARNYPSIGDLYRLYDAYISETKIKRGHYNSTTLVEEVLRLLPGVEKRRANGTRLVGLRLKKKVSNKGVWMEEKGVEDVKDN